LHFILDFSLDLGEKNNVLQHFYENVLQVKKDKKSVQDLVNRIFQHFIVVINFRS